MKHSTWQSVLLLGLAVVLACASSPLAVERLTIGQLQQYHVSYQKHSVTLIGKVTAMHALPALPMPWSKRCSPLTGIAGFILIDETGSLPVEILGSCFSAAMALPHDGDLIELTAEARVFVPEGQTSRVITAIAQAIVVLQ